MTWILTAFCVVQFLVIVVGILYIRAQRDTLFEIADLVESQGKAFETRDQRLFGYVQIVQSDNLTLLERVEKLERRSLQQDREPPRKPPFFEELQDIRSAFDQSVQKAASSILDRETESGDGWAEASSAFFSAAKKAVSTLSHQIDGEKIEKILSSFREKPKPKQKTQKGEAP